jgi:hypothetical protein
MTYFQWRDHIALSGKGKCHNFRVWGSQIPKSSSMNVTSRKWCFVSFRITKFTTFCFCRTSNQCEHLRGHLN